MFSTWASLSLLFFAPLTFDLSVGSADVTPVTSCCLTAADASLELSTSISTPDVSGSVSVDLDSALLERLLSSGLILLLWPSRASRGDSLSSGSSPDAGLQMIWDVRQGMFSTSLSAPGRGIRALFTITGEAYTGDGGGLNHTRPDRPAVCLWYGGLWMFLGSYGLRISGLFLWDVESSGGVWILEALPLIYESKPCCGSSVRNTSGYSRTFFPRAPRTIQGRPLIPWTCTPNNPDSSFWAGWSRSSLWYDSI